MPDGNIIFAMDDDSSKNSCDTSQDVSGIFITKNEVKSYNLEGDEASNHNINTSKNWCS